MKRSLAIVLLMTLTCVLASEHKYRRRAETRAHADPAADGAAAEGGAAGEQPPKQIKLDKIAILTPELDVSMSGKPQIIITRSGEQKPSELEHPKLLADDPCNLRQGYVLYQDKIEENGVNPVLYTKPSFCVLNKQTISFFNAENVHTLQASFDLKTVMANTEENYWLKSNCVPIYKVNPDGTQGKRIKIFCLEDEIQTQDWIKAVNTFHKCTLEEIEIGKTPASKIKTIIKRGEMGSDEDIDAKRLEEYENTVGSYEASSEEQNKKESAELDRMTKELMEEFRRHKELEAREKARLREERKRMNAKSSVLSAQTKCIEQALEVKSLEDEKTLEGFLDSLKLDREKNLWKQAQKRLEYMWKRESESIHGQEADLRKAEFEIREKMKKDLVQETAEWVKNLDPYDCYQNKLTGGNLAVMKQVCSNFFPYGGEPDLKVLLDCLNPKKFCFLCCKHYIGADDANGNKLRCETQCKKVMNEEANAYNIDYKLPKETGASTKRRRRR